VRSNTIRIRDQQPSALEIVLGVTRVLGSAAADAVLRRRPIDVLALFGVVVACTVIVINALFLQPGAHPAPFFANHARNAEGAMVSARLNATAQPRTAADAGRTEASALPRPSADIVADIQRELFRRGLYDGAIDGIYGPRTDAAIRDFEQRTGQRPGALPTEALLRAIVQSTLKVVRTSNTAAPVVTTGSTPNDPIAQLIGPSPRITAVQRALADFGYAQIKPSGTLDRETQAAIEKFERERKLPVTGQMSDRVVRELVAVTGRPLE
jgi:peptidoglycan hydrolase-like protein with peptidoglycan-binding domain